MFSDRLLKRAKTLLCCMLAGCIFISLLSCKNEESSETEKRISGNYGYRSLYFDLPSKEGYKIEEIGEIFLDGNAYCISLVYSHYSSSSKTYDYLTDIISWGMDGEIKYILEISKIQIVRAIFSSEYAFLAYSNQDLLDEQTGRKDAADIRADLVFFDKKTGETTRVIHPDMNAHSVFSLKGGFILVGERKIEKYSMDGTLVSVIQTDFSLPPSEISVFEDNGEIYLLSGDNEWLHNYYKLDFTNCRADYIVGTDTLSNDIISCTNNYYFTSDGEYKVDLRNKQKATIAKWNETDIRPLVMKGVNHYFPVDDTHFLRVCLYDDGSGEIGFFTYDNSINNNKTKIVIGGFGVFTDNLLQWAVYFFNSTNANYRAVLEDYTRDFSSSTPQEAQTSRLKLLKYFQEGNAPDIFYGDSFDYEYFGRSGMVYDLLPYINNDSELGLNDFVPSVRKLICPDAIHCYYAFSSFVVSGYFGLKSEFSSNDVSLFEIYEMSKSTGKTFTSTQSAPCIAGDALLYNFSRLWGAYKREPVVSQDELCQFVKICTDIGIDPAIQWGSLCTMQDVYNGQYLLSSSVSSNIFSFAADEKDVHDRIIFIGYPSIKGSVHLAIPNGQVAISSSTKNPDKCWELIRNLLLPSVQNKVDTFPIRNDTLDLMCQSSLNPELVKDSDMKHFVLGHEAVSETVVVDFKEIANSIDTVRTLDWGAYNIICEEISSFYEQQRSVEQIAETLDNRLRLYVEENY